MKLYLASLAVGILVGVIYSLFDVRSPAPPLVALMGLFGILLGEQLLPVGRQMLSGVSLPAAWQASKCTQHVFGTMTGRQSYRPIGKSRA
jgi:XapX domain-containing protein